MGGHSSKSQGTTTTTKKPPAGSISDVDRAVLDLKNARDRLQKYKAKLEMDEIKLLQRAKEAKDAGKNSQALGLLRLKKSKRRGVEDVENQLLTVLQMVETIDSRQNDKQIIGALRTGKDALAKLQKETTVEDILELMDQIKEQNEVENEVADILSNVPSLSVADEATIEAELEALEAAMKAEAYPDLPQVPTNKLPEIAQPHKNPNTAKPIREAVAS
jgi:Snf7